MVMYTCGTSRCHGKQMVYLTCLSGACYSYFIPLVDICRLYMYTHNLTRGEVVTKQTIHIKLNQSYQPIRVLYLQNQFTYRIKKL